jgi:hypothetical protein
MFDFIVFSIFLVFVTLLSISTIKTKIKNVELLEKFLESTIEKALITERLESELLKNSKNASSDEQGFVNFLSQSRDWAFEYIESVQEKIKDFESEVLPIINSLEKENIKDFKLSTIKMAESSKKLIKLLPEVDNE